MEQKMAKVTVNGETKEYPCGTSYRDIVDEYQKDTEFPIILVTADGKRQNNSGCFNPFIL